MLSLRSVHVALLFVSIMLLAGFGTWGLKHNYTLAGAISLGVGVLLVLYTAMFAARTERTLE